MQIQNKYSAVRNASMKDKQDEEEAMASMMEDLDEIDRTLMTAETARHNTQSRQVLSRQPEAKW